MTRKTDWLKENTNRNNDDLSHLTACLVMHLHINKISYHVSLFCEKRKEKESH